MCLQLSDAACLMASFYFYLSNIVWFYNPHITSREENGYRKMEVKLVVHIGRLSACAEHVGMCS